MHRVQYHLLVKRTEERPQSYETWWICKHWFCLKLHETAIYERLTCPLSSSRLLVSLRLSKDTVCFIHCAPQAGESGWKCILLGATTSARPATNQEELWKAYLTQTKTWQRLWSITKRKSLNILLKVLTLKARYLRPTCIFYHQRGQSPWAAHIQQQGTSQWFAPGILETSSCSLKTQRENEEVGSKMSSREK